MSASTPDDLATAFRSFERRHREAIGDADASSVSDLTATLDQHVAAAAAALGSNADLASIAAELERRPNDQWDEAVLDQVRTAATAAGSAIREIENRLSDED